MLTRRTVLLVALVAAALVPTVASAAGPHGAADRRRDEARDRDQDRQPRQGPRDAGDGSASTTGASRRRRAARSGAPGQCAVAWPPVYVKGTVQKHIKGVAATFGTIKRGTKRQLTINGLPAYTYHHDPAGVVLCDNVDGWFAVRPLVGARAAAQAATVVHDEADSDGAVGERLVTTQ